MRYLAQNIAKSKIYLRDFRYGIGSLLPCHKYLCCRPRGGLADSFAQISKCLLYAQAHQRILLVDAANAGQLHRLHDYFQVHSSASRFVHLVDSFNTSLPGRDDLSVFPAVDSRDLDSLFPVYDQSANAHIDPVSSNVITFDFNEKYRHDILFHEQCGSGASWNVFERLVLASNARAAILSRFQMLPPRFNAIHIRNTDLITNYPDQLRALMPKLLASSLPVLLCTDNPNTFRSSQVLLEGIDVFSIYPFPICSEQVRASPLHYNPATHGWDGDIPLLSDLLALALSQELFTLRLENGSFSGFSSLAQDLHSRPWILDRLFGSAIASLLRH